MPTGIPKDTVAHAAKMAEASKRRAAARAEKFGPPIQRTQAASTTSTLVSSSVPDDGFNYTVEEQDHAYTEKKNPIKRTRKSGVGAATIAEHKRTINLLRDALNELEEKNEALEESLAGLAETHSEVYAELLELNAQMQERVEDAERRLFSLLDLI